MQKADVGSNLIKVASTTARALKEKDDQVYCQPEVLYEGKMHPLSLCLGKGQSVMKTPKASLYNTSFGCGRAMHGQETKRNALGKSIWVLGGWSVARKTFTAVFYKCCNLLDADFLNRYSKLGFLLLHIQNTLQDRCHQPQPMGSRLGSERWGHTQNVTPQTENTPEQGFLTWVPLVPGAWPFSEVGAIPATVGCPVPSLASTH